MKLKQLTPTELQMMTIIWKLDSCNVREICQQLPDGKKLAYTSVSTIVRILEQKGYVKSEKCGRGHNYSPLLSRASYQSLALNHVVDTLFDHTPLNLVKQLLNNDTLTAEDINDLQDLINNRK